MGWGGVGWALCAVVRCGALTIELGEVPPVNQPRQLVVLVRAPPVAGLGLTLLPQAVVS